MRDGIRARAAELVKAIVKCRDPIFEWDYEQAEVEADFAMRRLLRDVAGEIYAEGIQPTPDIAWVEGMSHARQIVESIAAEGETR